MGALPILTGIGAIGGLIQGNKAQKAANKQASIQQGLLASEEARRKAAYDITFPHYGQAIDTLYGIANQNPADMNSLAFQQAQQMADQAYRRGADQFTFDLANRGIGGPIVAGGLARLQEARNRDLANYARNLALQAPDIQAGRITNAIGASQPGLIGSSLPIASQYGQMAQNQYALAGQAGQNTSQIVQQYFQNQMLQKQRQQQEQNNRDLINALQGGNNSITGINGSRGVPQIAYPFFSPYA